MNMLRSWYPAGHASEYTYQLVGKKFSQLKSKKTFYYSRHRTDKSWWDDSLVRWEWKVGSHMYYLTIYLNGPFSKVGSNGSPVWRSSGIEIFVISAQTVNAGKAGVTIALMAKS